MNVWIITNIIPGLYLGNSFSRDPRILKKFKIKNIITANEEPCLHDIHHNNLCLGWDDSPQQSLFKDNKIDIAYHFIDMSLSNGENVLVHCAAGISRSASIVIYYLMRKLNMRLIDALTFVKSKRSIVCPNNGFIQQLLQYEKMKSI